MRSFLKRGFVVVKQRLVGAVGLILNCFTGLPVPSLMHATNRFLNLHNFQIYNIFRFKSVVFVVFL